MSSTLCPAVIETAKELLRAGHFAPVVSLCSNVPDAAARLMAARALASLGRDDDARSELACCIALDPGSAEAHGMLGAIAMRRGDLAGAQVLLRDAIRLGDRSAAGLYESVRARITAAAMGANRS